MSVIATFVDPTAKEITQSAEQIRMRLVSRLIKDIIIVLQKLLKYFNDTAI